MRVLVAVDGFTGTMTAQEAAAAVAEGWRRHDATVEVDLAPMSDGGPGFVAAVHAGGGGELHALPARGPVGDPLEAEVLRTSDGVVYVESASVCGVHLLPGGVRRPLDATSEGLGDLLNAVGRLEPERVVIGVGGTATTDGGRGCVEVVRGAGGWTADVPLVAATDVANPLLGSAGAAAVFAPQKGASRDDVAELERRLTAWARAQGGDPDAPGAGAGGGLGYGLLLLGASRVAGVQVVVDVLGLEGRAAAADLVITGEGCLDGTSLQGKVPRGVAWAAQRAGRPCVALAGRVLLGRRELSAAGIDAAYSVEDLAGSAAAARDEPARRLADLAERVAATWDLRTQRP